MAPDVSSAEALWKRYQKATADWKISQAQEQYFGNVAQVALHDLLQVVDRVDETVRPAAGRNTQVAEEFSAVLKISDQRGEAVRQSKARAKAEKEAAALAAGGDEAGPEGSTPAKPPRR